MSNPALSIPAISPQPNQHPDPLAPFLAPTRAWFQETLGQPTPPQAQGWPAIQRGEHTLILAPTGSGKTLSAFLWGIDQIFRELTQDSASTVAHPESSGQSNKSSKNKKKVKPQTRLLYISPLKALNNDIDRNLRVPLAGIRKMAKSMELDYPELRVSVRSGDTPQRERQAMLRTPPHIFITTPESLYLMLTSPKAREIFATVRTVIVDEIHTLAGSKRGVHLSLSLERLQQVATQPIQRIGLSATIQPLDEVARYLGGNEWNETEEEAKAEEEGESGNIDSGEVSLRETKEELLSDSRVLVPRPVTIIDAGYRKELSLHVETVVEDFRDLPDGSVWPSIIPRVVDLIDAHNTTLIFVNNRRSAERAADRINEQMVANAGGDNSGLTERGVAKGLGMMAASKGTQANPIRTHHGSMSKETRLELEKDLKAGRLPALVGTSSLELGIDIGTIDLVIQLQSPKTVSQGLQRVGRSGHLVGQTSQGHIFPTHREDVMEAAAVARGMLQGDVEPTKTPRNSLDVLCQQIVAMISVEDCTVQEIHDLVRCAYAYEDLTLRALQAVLDMLSGRYPTKAHRNLRARIVWDRVHNKLAALPGSRLLALTNGGAITDRGTFGAYLSDGKTKLGELDEEFVYETRIGDTFMLGSQVWRVVDLTDDKVVVADAAGATPRMPFWRGDFPWRPYDLGSRVGAFRRTVAEQLDQLRSNLDLSSYREIFEFKDEPAVLSYLEQLQQEYALDANSAWHVIDYVASQLDHAGAISSDKTVLVEVFEDAVGDPRMVIQAPFGGRVNGLWGVALTSALRERTGVEVEVQTNDDGILFRFPDAEAEFPLDLVTQMTPGEARELILRELPDTAVFGAQFRQNAARALLLPGLGVGKRTPFWLQRLRAKDLLQIVRQFDDFPIVAETYRDCLEEVMDLPHLERVLIGIQQGDIEVVTFESLHPSPVAQSLMWNFVEFYMYEWDTPKAERQLQTLSVNRELLQDLLTDIDLADLLRPEAIQSVRERLQHTMSTARARTAEELALFFQDLGDLTFDEVANRTTVDPTEWLAQLDKGQRIVQLPIPTSQGVQERWIDAGYAFEYITAFGLSEQFPQRREFATESPNISQGNSAFLSQDEARQRILTRYLTQIGPVTMTTILARYAFPTDWLQRELECLVENRDLVHGHFTPAAMDTATDSSPVAGRPQNGSVQSDDQRSDQNRAEAEFVDRRTLEQIHRRTLNILRQEVRPVPLTVYADFLTRWQHLHPDERLDGAGALRQVLQQLRVSPVVGTVWERDVLRLRLADGNTSELETLCHSGEVVWVGTGGVNPRRGRIRFLFRGEGNTYLEQAPTDIATRTDTDSYTEDEPSEVNAQEPETLSSDATAVYEFLKSEGAVFQADIRDGLDLTNQAAQNALTELAMAGLVTNDSLAALRRILGQKVQHANANRPRSGRSSSSLEAQLAERLGSRSRRSSQPGGLRRPSRSEFRAAKKRVRERLAEDLDITPAVSQSEGRWTLVHRFGVMGKKLSLAEQIARQTHQLLARYGVVTRESLAHEAGAWEWNMIYQELQRLEIRGEVRRGIFVHGLTGVQFALPEVVERLRELSSEFKSEIRRENDASEAEALVLMNACDPANLYGPANEMAPLTQTGKPLAFSRLPSTWLVLSWGLPILLVEQTGASLTTVKGTGDGMMRHAIRVWLQHASSFMQRVTVKEWNGQPVLEGDGASMLESIGFYRDYPAMTWER